MERKRDQYIEVEISEFSKKGNGVGFVNAKDGTLVKLEVPFTAPNDKVLCLVTKKKGGVYTGKLENIIVSSASRIAPKCIHFGICGGCRLQHLSYDTQARIKELQVRKYFQQILTPSVTFHSIISAPDEWQYRNKMEFSFSSDSAKNNYLGLIMAHGRGRVMNLTECHLTNPWFIEALTAVRNWWLQSELEAYHMMKNTGSLRTLTVREGKTTGDRMVMLTVSGNPDFALQRHHLDSFVRALKESVEPTANATLSIFLRIQQIAKGMETEYFEMHLNGKDHITENLSIILKDSDEKAPMSFTVSPTAFFQPNSAQASVLYSKAIELGSFSKEDVVYDLYCGTGTLGICIAKHVKTVIGVEISREASLDARTNAKHNGLENYTVYTGGVSQILKENAFVKPDVIMLDPPRAGLEASALKQIVELNAPKIVYISCNPETQSGNIKDLIDAGYKLIAIQPIDQFPQTAHIENIALLTRSHT
jgi:23S rRNA (uracil1939-C5)-methyltransferase